VKAEPVLAKLNALRKDTQGEGGEEEKAIYHGFCFISYEVGPFTDFVERGKDPAAKKGVAPGPRARELLQTLEGMRAEVGDDQEDMEFVALDMAVKFISRALGDFQSYLNDAGEGA